MIHTEAIEENLSKCPSYNGCNQNFCPLDLDLHLRSGKEQDKCKWMREPKQKKIGKRVFTSGGAVMPDAILNFVPRANVARLNSISKQRWIVLKKK